MNIYISISERGVLVLQVKQEFKDLIPPLAPDERFELEESLLKYGCRDAIVSWNDFVIDGHNRYEICSQYGIDFRVEDMSFDFDNEDEVKQWIIRNQFARRNIDKYQRSVLALQLKDLIAGKAKENISIAVSESNKNRSNPSSANLPNLEIKPIDTREEIAKIAGVSGRTIDKVETIEKEAPEPVRQAARNNVISINKAHEITKAVKELPEDQRADEATRLMNDRTRERNKEIDRRHSLAQGFAKFVEGAGAFVASEEKLLCYLEFSPKEVVDDLVENCDLGIATLQSIKAMYSNLKKPRAVK